MRNLFKSVSLIAFVSISFNSFGQEQNCQDMNADQLNNIIKNSIINDTPFKLKGCFNIDKTIVIEGSTVVTVDETLHKNRVNIDLSESTFKVNYTGETFPVIQIKGFIDSGDNYGIENGYIKMPSIENITTNPNQCQHISHIDGNSAENHLVPGVYDETIEVAQATTGNHTQNIGIMIEAMRNTQVTFNKISGFCVGVALIPQDSCKDISGDCKQEGVVGYNAFYDGEFENNYTDIMLNSKHVKGWVNQNYFYHQHFLSDDLNAYCEDFAGSGKDKQCKDILIDGKFRGTEITLPDNNSFFEPIFDSSLTKSDNFFSRSGSYQMVYYPSTPSKLRVNIGNTYESKKLLFYGVETSDVIENCEGHEMEYHCTTKGFPVGRTQYIKDTAGSELPSVGPLQSP